MESKCPTESSDTIEGINGEQMPNRIIGHYRTYQWRAICPTESSDTIEGINGEQMPNRIIRQYRMYQWRANAQQNHLTLLKVSMESNCPTGDVSMESKCPTESSDTIEGINGEQMPNKIIRQYRMYQWRAICPTESSDTIEGINGEQMPNRIT